MPTAPRTILNRLLCVVALFAMMQAGALYGCSGGGGGSAPPQGLYENYPLDGVVIWSDFSTIETDTVEIRDTWGTGALIKTSDIRWAWTNDDQNLYLAVEWTDDTYDHGYDADGPINFDGLQVLFDNDGDGTYETGEDKRIVIAASVGSQYIDEVFSSGNEDDQVADGYGKLGYDTGSQKYTAEFLLPLAPDANGEDADFTAAPTCSLAVFDNTKIGLGQGNMGTTHGFGPDTTGWMTVPYTAVGAHDYPAMPTNLTGLIVFTSEHETHNNEIYSYDPASGAITQITNLPGLYKDNPSLSHDRTKVAFHATPDPADYSGYEIYVIHVDGSGLTQLTSNSILDGHPGWHPDNSTIAYASFRDGHQASIVLMDESGTEIDDLTPEGMGYDDNDPDFLPDGRIIFKTNRFSTFPQVRIAVMEPDGSNVEQLTSLSGVSDHDPVGNTTHTIFERFNKNTDYATDLESGFTPWDLVQVGLDGSDETIVLSDGWINWLPIYSPDGQYILYLKTAGYTDVQLMTLGGQALGRLIPGMTKVKYVDWK